ncbi:cupin domain-containing protein [Luteimonas sp. 50]|uniref:Cupin domain-containing protein n=1 Tax=Cognatiluteimonas sedimenti TaxID=2927791 RepID=A0ABT0A1V0_9GAMM|nr:cupin domain-containing protein [Lysobacter sedimenti]MCJ0824930.1 cupin domain-containing protein [Lysobacter sedimenti]
MSTPRKRKPAAKPAGSAPRALPFEIDATAQPPLGMPAANFLRGYWQKRPLLIRNAFPGFVSPLSPEDLAGLACEEAALSRIVAHEREHDRWLLRHGPFPEQMFPTLPDHDWTLLVQDVDKWDADIAALLPAFGFLPRWRIDDVMVSFAAPGGSVGAHVDQYDVFLLQAQGHRRWQVDASESMGRGAPPVHFRLDTELRLLQRFTPTHDWVLGPGDMLYLPPGVPHHGVAEDACLTFSIGMRAPAAAELLGDFVDTLAGEADDSLRYRDPDLVPPADPNEIDAAAMQRVVEALNLLRMNDPERLGDWFGRFITTYRSPGEVAAAGTTPARIETEWQLEHGASLHRHPFTRMAWRRAGRGARLYASGEELAMPLRDARRLAAAATIDGQAYAALSPAGRDAVMALYVQGHYQLPADEEE